MDARLEWLDGPFPIRDEGSLTNLELERSENALSLHIRNFTVENYGQYHCRCVKEYSRSALEPPSNLLSAEMFRELFCSDQDNVVNLLPYGRLVPDAMEHYFVSAVGQSHQLNCNSGNWSVWKAQSLAPQYINQQVNYSIAISTIADQAKVVCLDSYDTLHKIFYVSIEDHPQLPLQLIQPSTGDGSDSIAVDLTENFQYFCVFHFSVPSVREIDFVVYRNGRRDDDNDDVALPLDSNEYNPRLSGPEGSSSLGNGVGYLNWVSLRSGFGFGVISPLVTDKRRADELYWNSTYSCRVTQKWEADITVNFTIARPGECKQAKQSSMHMVKCM